VRNRALLMQDVESLTGAWRVETGSDIFCIASGRGRHMLIMKKHCLVQLRSQPLAVPCVRRFP